MASSSSPPYAYVFSSQLPKPLLRKLDDGNALSRLHNKYWNKSIDNEESTWASAHGEPMDTDESDIARGCFPLQVNIPNFRIPKLWVREDYIRIYDYCDSHCSNRRGVSLWPCAIITGQPGSGKSYWILYAIRRRLGQAQPVLWYFSNYWYLFVEGGVFKYPETIDPALFSPFVWTFIDANDFSSALQFHLSTQYSNLFIILATSPKPDLWQPITKNSHSAILIMNPWTWDEICKAADLHELTDMERTTSKNLFLEYGPTPRICIDFIRMPTKFAEFRSHRARAISDLNLDSLLQFVRNGEELDMKLSHSVILIKRQDVGDLLTPVIEPITLSVEQLLKKRLIEVEQKERLQTYLLFSTVRQSRMLSGMIFESFAQLHLQETGALDLVPMVFVPAKGRANAKWEYLPMGGAGRRDPIVPIRLQLEEIVEYDCSELKSFQAGALYVPASSTQVGFDSLVLVDQVLYIFQFTIADEHGIKEGIMKFLSQAKLQAVLNEVEWRFVFVIPRGSRIVCPQSNVAKMSQFWGKANLFAAELDTRKRKQPQDDDSANIKPKEPNHPPSSSRTTRSSTKPLAQKATSSKALGKRKATD